MPRLHTIGADLRASVDASLVVGWKFWVKVLGRSLVTPQVHAVLLFRLASALAHTPLRPLAFVVRSFSVALTGAEIHPDATIGPGFGLVHSVGVVIGSGVVIGEGGRISQGVTLGEPGRGVPDERWGFPTLADHVTIGANATIIGPHHLGTGCIVGANAVVTADVAEGVVVGGIPAKQISTVTLEAVLRGQAPNLYSRPN